MIRVLHTSDVHLTLDAPERREALRDPLAKAEEEAFDVVTIGGDLFDRPEDVEALRSDLRNDLLFGSVLPDHLDSGQSRRGSVPGGMSSSVTRVRRLLTSRLSTGRIPMLPFASPDSRIRSGRMMISFSRCKIETPSRA